MKVGIFDSGIGGEAIALELKRLLPEIEIMSVNDHKNVPYGTKTESEIISLTDLAIQPLITANCKNIVIACNTATTIAITHLRARYPKIKFVGIEPMIKPACKITKTKNIAVCATPRTLQSARYNELKDAWAQNINVVEPNCNDWAALIEDGKSDQINIDKLITNFKSNKIDVVVLGCTHYHWLKQRFIDKTGPNMTILEPSDAIANRIVSITD